MGDNKGRRSRRSSNWGSQDGVNQKHYSWIKSRARSNRRLKSKRNSPSTFNPSIESYFHTDITALNNDNVENGPNNTNALVIAGIVIGSILILAMIIFYLIRHIRKRKESPEPQEDQDDEEELPSSPPLTITFVKHNHSVPELCTTPDTQPILDYYSGLADVSLPPIINISSDKSSRSINEDNNDRKSKPVEANENTRKSLEDKEYVPQYYNGMEIPPLGARIIPLERQVQIAKELTSTNPNSTNYKRKSSRSISSMLSMSSILSINSKRKSGTSSNFHNNNNNNNNNINNNSSTTNSLSQISETAKIVP